MTKVVPHCRFAKTFVSGLQNDVTYQIGTSMESERTSGTGGGQEGGSGSGGSGEITE